jgi:hypothetical protein
LIDYTNPACFQCDRQSSCQYPCLNYSNHLIRLHHAKEDQNIKNSIKTLDLDKNTDVLKKNNPYVARVTEVDISNETGDLKALDGGEKGVGNVNKNDELDEFMYNFIESAVDQPEYLQVCNELVHPSKILDWEILLDYMKEKNRVYSEENGLCEVCHSELVERKEYEEIWGSRQISERLWVCRNGC